MGESVNIALPAYTDDAGWHTAFHAVVPTVLRSFRPQVLVTQDGCDTHHEDPLAELALTVDGQRGSYATLHQLAHELCDGKWVAFGGGGYGLVALRAAGMDAPARRVDRRAGRAGHRDPGGMAGGGAIPGAAGRAALGHD